MTVEQLITNQHFIDWVKKGAIDADVSWLQSDDEGIVKNVGDAKLIIESMSFEELHTDHSKKVELWNSISEDMNHKSSGGVSWLKWGAISVVILAALVWVANLYLFTNTVHQTDFAELREIHFPDGSGGMLNANSSLEFDKDWKDDELRKVQLEGEAFFDITHLNNDQRFVVETAHLDIEVTGTRFVVNSRPYGMQVTLEEGEIRLHNKNSDTPFRTMKPGETGFYDSKTSRFNIETKDIQLHTSWRSGVYKFSNTPFSEVVRIIKENYGYRVDLAKSSIWEEQISGTIAAHSIHDLSAALSGILGIDVKVKNQTIQFH